MKQYTDRQIEELEAKWFQNGLGIGCIFGIFFALMAWFLTYHPYN